MGMSVSYFRVKGGNLKGIFQKNEEGGRREGLGEEAGGGKERRKGERRRAKKEKLTLCIFLNY